MGRGNKSTTDDVGEPIRYDPDFHGPLKHRSCTDVICLFIFIVFIGCWAGIGIYAFVNGDPNKLLVPRDSDGNRCGFDVIVRDKPNLFFFDLTKCATPSVAFTGCSTPQVCVEKCPETAYYYTPGASVANLICKYGVRPTVSTAEDLIENGNCARWALPSQPVLKRCLYKTEDRRKFRFGRVANTAVDEISTAKRYLEITRSWVSLFVQYFVSFFSDSYDAEKVGYDIVNDIVNSWREILLGVAICIVGSIIYIFILRWIAAILVWLSILGAIAALSFGVYWAYSQYRYYSDNPYAHEKASNWFQELIMKSGTWMGLLIAFSILLAILLLVVIFLRKRIVLAIALIKEGSKAVGATTAALFFPVIPWILQLGVIAYVLAVAVYISTVGNPLYEVRDFSSNECNTAACNNNTVQNGDTCDVNTFSSICSSPCPAQCRFIQMSDSYAIYLHIFNGVGLFWGVFFISALCEMILASTFATWYWTFNKSNVPFFTVTTATLRTFRYGTLAFGSLIITICRIIRVILEYIDHKLKKYENPVTKAIMCCMKCFFWCLESFLRFINRNAYIMCAIHGKNFCISAKDAFSLLMRNILRVFVLDKITDFIFFLSKIAIVVGVSASIYSIIVYVSQTEITYIFVPVVFVAVCAYFICTVFFTVYTMAIDTLFLCFLEDCERNDGSPEKPYFMSKGLMQVLNKKNNLTNDNAQNQSPNGSIQVTATNDLNTHDAVEASTPSTSTVHPVVSASCGPPTSSGNCNFETLLLGCVRQHQGTPKIPKKRLAPGAAVITANRIPSASLTETQRKQSQQKVIRRDSTSSDTDSEVPTYQDSDDPEEFLDELRNSVENDFVDDHGTIEVNRWVLVQYATKKTTKYYVGKVIEKNGADEWQIKFARFRTNKFIWPNVEDEDIVDSANIVRILPEPTEDRRGITFSVKFDGLNLC
ncbi:Plasma-membrane choline transporter [Popillia japonica]|uniref:Plasma-membrane choline transporter n=1 Tax=Popillia japonica TaxID=7064 RepID=A0AAW1KJB1_POPJA